MSGVYRSGGRGGAGNFVSQKDQEAADQARRENDPEAQQPASTPPPQPAGTASAGAQYVRTGRGGAGNFAEPPTIAESKDRQDVVERTRAAVGASLAGQPRVGLSGRGGAGNWTDDGAGGNAEGAEEEEEQQARQIADKIVHDIDASLAPPPKTYHQHDRDME